ncbi:hypothetical protein SDC9_149011 [bioreactor metagenome]|uniref:Uncharacterized protein n=1 Tax=bioreactor metagenome TaxID=1076179 RepID=A0A645EL02_9ZZZZ|nr:hypothetical protein [Erysipelotrichaceae bacterium]
MEKSELKKIKRSISNSFKSDAIEINGKIYHADDYLLAYKRRLGNRKIVLSIAAPLCWLISTALLSNGKTLTEFGMLVCACVFFYVIQDTMVQKIIPDDCLKHLRQD